MTAHEQSFIPASVRPAHDPIVALTDHFCQVHLTPEYQMMCRRLAGVLARKRPSPLLRGKPEVWACGIVRAIGWVNYLSDSSRKPCVKSSVIDHAFGVPAATGESKSKSIRDMLKIQRFDWKWMLPSGLDESPLVWLIPINGLPMDVRRMPREIQEEAHRRGLIPYVPAQEANATVTVHRPDGEIIRLVGKPE